MCIKDHTPKWSLFLGAHPSNYPIVIKRYSNVVVMYPPLTFAYIYIHIHIIYTSYIYMYVYICIHIFICPCMYSDGFPMPSRMPDGLEWTRRRGGVLKKFSGTGDDFHVMVNLLPCLITSNPWAEKHGTIIVRCIYWIVTIHGCSDKLEIIMEICTKRLWDSLI